jgi:hypothetical protein
MNDELNQKIEAIRQEGERTEVRIILNEDKSSEGEVFLKRWSDRQRNWRATKILLQMWGLALLSVFVPLAHFVLVPLFLLIGLVMYPIMLGQKSTVLGGVGACPNCDKRFEIIRCPEKWPLEDICNHCNRHVKIIPRES